MWHRSGATEHIKDPFENKIFLLKVLKKKKKKGKKLVE